MECAATAKNSLSIGACRSANNGESPEFREAFSSMGPAVSTTINRTAPVLMALGGEPLDGGAFGLSSEFSCTSGDNDQVGAVAHRDVFSEIVGGRIGVGLVEKDVAGGVGDWLCQARGAGINGSLDE